MVVHRRLIEAHRGVLKPGVIQVIHDALLDVVDRVLLVITTQGIGLVDENGVLHVRIELPQLQDRLDEAADRFHVIVLRIKHPHYRSSGAVDTIGIEVGLQEVNLSRQIPDLKISE
jgi:hypothetical protein